MKLELLPSVVGRSSDKQFLSTYCVNDYFAIDAGSIGLTDDLHSQQSIREILLTHSHIDHIASLGPFIDNTTCNHPETPITIHCSQAVGDALTTHYFNDVLWPDVLRLPTPDSPYARIETFRAGRSFQVRNVTVTPIEVDHSVPAYGFIISDSEGSVVFTGDTGPTDQLWKAANQVGDVRAVVVEVAFPNEMQAQANVAGHLTPLSLQREIAKLANGNQARVFAVHLKACHAELIAQQLAALGMANVERLRPGRAYIV